MDEVLAADMAAAPNGRVGQFHNFCACLANDHNTAQCKYLEADTTDEFLRVREANYQRIARSRRGARQPSRSGKAYRSQADRTST